MMTTKMTGVIAPILTPFNDDLSFARELYVSHAHWLLQQGIHYIAPFGTTGEALSMSVGERISAVDTLIDGAIDPGVLMPGAGLCNLDDTVTLCRHAVQRGCAAVMTLPPFFYKNASDDGLYAYFVRLIEAVNNVRLKICMYHIPPLAGIGFTPDLARRLARNFPDAIVAYKDSSGDFENTQAVIAAAPNLAVFPGSETFLRSGLEYGAAGCISATCNVNPAGIRHVFDVATAAKQGDLDRVADEMAAFRKRIEGDALIPAMKGLLARQRGDRRWRNVRPPLLSVSEADTQALIDSLDSAGNAILGRLING
ncbi:dihydrodipicolinate synthase family protein [Candidatus Spongiihabitans sp.]|uniref:dihydrodipicolinate synthase family protein n=1 Tax=Candidatus Spongiihabitans sp. TaxID=3101308 RepID=UPI003C6F5F12